MPRRMWPETTSMTLPIAPKLRSKDPALPTGEASVRSLPIGQTQSDVISPELALVSPELAEAARLRLPDQPWELALRRARLSLLRDAGGDRSRGSTSVSVPDPSASRIAHLAATVAARSDLLEAKLEGRARRRRIVRGIVLATAIVGALLVGLPLLDGWNGGSGESVLTTLPPRASSDTRVDTQSPLLPSAGYVVSPGGSFLTDASGRRIASFTLPLRCGDDRQLQIRDIPVSGRSLRLTTRAVGRAITVRLTGRILRQDRVRGVVAAEGLACSADPVAFFARLS